MSFETKDSGERVEFASGMVRDVQTGKPRYDLIPLGPLRRLAELYGRGAEKYGDSNWQLASSNVELARFKASAFRHLMQLLEGETDEDHGAAVVFNVFAIMWLEAKLAERPAAQGGVIASSEAYYVGERSTSCSECHAPEGAYHQVSCQKRHGAGLAPCNGAPNCPRHGIGPHHTETGTPE